MLPGKHSVYKARQTPMLPKPPLYGEQPLIHFEQSSREFPVCLSLYMPGGTRQGVREEV